MGARARGGLSGLDWREYTAGCASSVLAVHALIAAAADPATSRADARRIDAAYLAIGALITILDSLVDQAADTAAGQPGFIRLFEPGELAGRLRSLTRHEALSLASRRSSRRSSRDDARRCRGLLHDSRRRARAAGARDAAAAVRRELSPTIWPTLAVMRAWRTAKRGGTARPTSAPSTGNRMSPWTGALRNTRPDRESADQCQHARGWSVTFALCLLPALLPASAALAARARVAHTLAVKDEARLRMIKSSGSVLVDEGPAHGTLPGTARVHFTYNGDPTVTAQIMISGRSGTIQARGSARLSSPTSAAPSFAGTLTITSGTGRYAHAKGSGKLYGVYYRRTYALTVQTEGTLHY